MGDVEEEDLLLPLEHGQQASASENLPVGGEPDVVRLVAARSGPGQRHGGDHLPVSRRRGVEVHDRQKIRGPPRLVSRPDEKVFFGPFAALTLAFGIVEAGLSDGSRRRGGDQENKGCSKSSGSYR